jgi:hypothetical protein
MHQPYEIDPTPQEHLPWFKLIIIAAILWAIAWNLA